MNCNVAGAIHIKSNNNDIVMQVPPVSSGAIYSSIFIKKGIGVYVAFGNATVKIAKFHKCI